MSADTRMPCSNTAALERHERDSARPRVNQSSAESRCLEDEPLLNEMILDQSGESEDDEELMLLVLAAGVEAITEGSCSNRDRIIDLIKSRAWFERAVNCEVMEASQW